MPVLSCMDQCLTCILLATSLADGSNHRLQCCAWKHPWRTVLAGKMCVRYEKHDCNVFITLIVISILSLSPKRPIEKMVS